jgi:CRP-like cAMP-binding protein
MPHQAAEGRTSAAGGGGLARTVDGRTFEMLAWSHKRHFVKNTILESFSPLEKAAIGPFLEAVVLKERIVLHDPRRPVDYVHFVESGVISLRTIAAGSMLETAIVGNQGAVGASSVFGAHLPMPQSVVLFPGTALRIHIDHLRRLMDEHPRVREILTRYVQALVTHSAQTGFCGVRHSLEPRLASWLCLTCDAADHHVLPITHDSLSAVLGLRRAGVTEALNRFEEQGLIQKMRGVLQVYDRKHLQQKTCSCYGIITKAYVSAARAPTAEPEKTVS